MFHHVAVLAAEVIAGVVLGSLLSLTVARAMVLGFAVLEDSFNV